MGSSSSKQKSEKSTIALLIVGTQQSKINVSLNFLTENFGYFKKRMCLPSRDTNEVVSFKLPTISESIMMNVLDFITIGY